MGKLSKQQLPVVQRQQGGGGDGVGSRIFFCPRCSMVLTRIAKEFNSKCAVVILLSLAVFVYTLFSVLHLHSKQSGFDAKDSIKLSATVQTSFRLQKPVSELVPRISELEYEIFGEIGVPSTKVAILSIHQEAGISNWTNVKFGVLSDPPNVPINPVFLSVLKSTLLELYLEESNLTLTNTTFGQPSSFEILNFSGGITLIPEKSPFWHMPQILFNFTLNNSIDEIKENLSALKQQLSSGLHLMHGEIVYVQLTNNNGSTRDSPVIVAASITSESGFLLQQRLRELAEIITGSPAKNLGLDNSVFGKVKEVRLSSSLNRSLHASPPTYSPSPSPSPVDLSRPSISPSPLSQSGPPAPLPSFHHFAPCSNCDASAPSDASRAFAPSPENYSHRTLPPVPSSPTPSVKHDGPNCGSTIPPSSSPTSDTYPTDPNLSPSSSTQPSKGRKSLMSRGHSPLAAVSYGSSHGRDNEAGKNLLSPSPLLSSVSSSSSSLMPSSFYRIWWICVIALLMPYLLCWMF